MNYHFYGVLGFWGLDNFLKRISKKLFKNIDLTHRNNPYTQFSIVLHLEIKFFGISSKNFKLLRYKFFKEWVITRCIYLKFLCKIMVLG